MTGSGRPRHLKGMFRKAGLAVMFVVVWPLMVAAQPVADGCLTPEQARSEVAASKLTDIQHATRVARAKVKGELVSANLCRLSQRFVYVLAILAPGGKVSRVTVDAATGVVQEKR